MERRRRSVAARVGLGLAGLTAAVALFAPHEAPGASHRSPAQHATTAPAGSTADPGCQVVDANGLPLVDSQYEQRTGHAPC